MLSWEGEPSCDPDDLDQNCPDFDLELELPSPDCDLNHLGDRQLRLEDPGVAISPARGFMAGTCYWGSGGRLVGFDEPVAYVDHGGACRQEASALLQADTIESSPPPDGACVFASIDNDSQNGATPEVLTLQQEWPLTTRQLGRLGWYYEYRLDEAGQVGLRFPIGVMRLSVNAASSRALGRDVALEVFQGDEEVGRLSYPLEAPEDSDEGFSDQGSHWTALRIEYGFQTLAPVAPAPRGPDDSDEASGPPSEIYYRVVPIELAGDPQATRRSYPIDAPGAGTVTAAAALSTNGEVLAMVGGTGAFGFEDALLTRTRHGAWERRPSGDGWLTGVWVSPSGEVFTWGDEQLRVGDRVTECDAGIAGVADLGKLERGGDDGADDDDPKKYRALAVATEDGLRLAIPSEGRCEPWPSAACRGPRDCLAGCDDPLCRWRCQIYSEPDTLYALEACLSDNDCFTPDDDPDEAACAEACAAQIAACDADPGSALPAEAVTAVHVGKFKFSLGDEGEASRRFLTVAVADAGVHALELDDEQLSSTWYAGFPGAEAPDGEGDGEAQLPADEVVTRLTSGEDRLWALTEDGLHHLSRRDPAGWTRVGACDDEGEGECYPDGHEARSLVAVKDREGNSRVLVSGPRGVWDLDRSETLRFTELFEVQDLVSFAGRLYAASSAGLLLLEGE